MNQITPFYAGLLALLYVGLAVQVIRLRRRERVALGDGGRKSLQRAMRVHVNFAEYVPLALILLLLAELAGAAGFTLHALGLALLIGRVLHAFGVSQAEENYRFRVAGMALTFVALISGALLCLSGSRPLAFRPG
jgi:uncharacterized membrane protein YecN with MAPEG domain